MALCVYLINKTQIMSQLKLLFVFSLAFTFSVHAAGDNTASRRKHFNLSNGVALSGYDPVAYFSTKGAAKGSSKFSAQYMGISYYFCTAENKAAFDKNPSAYEPQYGGWCAYAMGNTGEKVEVDPETFKILNGKLYLFYNKFFNNTLKSWNKDETKLKESADRHWAETIK